jgi:hypothetical protein
MLPALEKLPSKARLGDWLGDYLTKADRKARQIR